MQPHHPAAQIASVRLGATKQQQHQKRQHDQRLRGADQLRRRLQHLRDDIGVHHHANADGGEIEGVVRQIPAELMRRRRPQIDRFKSSHDRRLARGAPKSQTRQCQSFLIQKKGHNLVPPFKEQQVPGVSIQMKLG